MPAARSTAARLATSPTRLRPSNSTRCHSPTTSSAANDSSAATRVRAAIINAREDHGERCGCLAIRRAASAICEVHSCGLSPIRIRSAMVNVPTAGSRSSRSSISSGVMSDTSPRAVTNAAPSGTTRLARSLVSTQPRATWSCDGKSPASIDAAFRQRDVTNGQAKVMLARCDSGNARTSSGVSIPCGRVAPAAAVLDMPRVGTATTTGSGDSLDTCITSRPP